MDPRTGQPHTVEANKLTQKPARETVAAGKRVDGHTVVLTIGDDGQILDIDDVITIQGREFRITSRADDVFKGKPGTTCDVDQIKLQQISGDPIDRNLEFQIKVLTPHKDKAGFREKTHTVDVSKVKDKTLKTQEATFKIAGNRIEIQCGLDEQGRKTLPLSAKMKDQEITIGGVKYKITVPRNAINVQTNAIDLQKVKLVQTDGQEVKWSKVRFDELEYRVADPSGAVPATGSGKKPLAEVRPNLKNIASEFYTVQTTGITYLVQATDRSYVETVEKTIECQIEGKTYSYKISFNPSEVFEADGKLKDGAVAKHVVLTPMDMKAPAVDKIPGDVVFPIAVLAGEQCKRYEIQDIKVKDCKYVPKTHKVTQATAANSEVVIDIVKDGKSKTMVVEETLKKTATHEFRLEFNPQTATDKSFVPVVKVYELEGDDRKATPLSPSDAAQEVKKQNLQLKVQVHGSLQALEDHEAKKPKAKKPKEQTFELSKYTDIILVEGADKDKEITTKATIEIDGTEYEYTVSFKPQDIFDADGELKKDAASKFVIMAAQDILIPEQSKIPSAETFRILVQGSDGALQKTHVIKYKDCKYKEKTYEVTAQAVKAAKKAAEIDIVTSKAAAKEATIVEETIMVEGDHEFCIEFDPQKVSTAEYVPAIKVYKLTGDAGDKKRSGGALPTAEVVNLVGSADIKVNFQVHTSAKDLKKSRDSDPKAKTPTTVTFSALNCLAVERGYEVIGDMTKGAVINALKGKGTTEVEETVYTTANHVYKMTFTPSELSTTDYEPTFKVFKVGSETELTDAELIQLVEGPGFKDFHVACQTHSSVGEMLGTQTAKKKTPVATKFEFSDFINKKRGFEVKKGVPNVTASTTTHEVVIHYDAAKEAEYYKEQTALVHESKDYEFHMKFNPKEVVVNPNYMPTFIVYKRGTKELVDLAPTAQEAPSITFKIPGKGEKHYSYTACKGLEKGVVIEDDPTKGMSPKATKVVSIYPNHEGKVEYKETFQGQEVEIKTVLGGTHEIKLKLLDVEGLAESGPIYKGPKRNIEFIVYDISGTEKKLVKTTDVVKLLGKEDLHVLCPVNGKRQHKIEFKDWRTAQHEASHVPHFAYKEKLSPAEEFVKEVRVGDIKEREDKALAAYNDNMHKLAAGHSGQTVLQYMQTLADAGGSGKALPAKFVVESEPKLRRAQAIFVDLEAKYQATPVDHEINCNLFDGNTKFINALVAYAQDPNDNKFTSLILKLGAENKYFPRVGDKAVLDEILQSIPIDVITKPGNEEVVGILLTAGLVAKARTDVAFVADHKEHLEGHARAVRKGKKGAEPSVWKDDKAGAGKVLRSVQVTHSLAEALKSKGREVASYVHDNGQLVVPSGARTFAIDKAYVRRVQDGEHVYVQPVEVAKLREEHKKALADEDSKELAQVAKVLAKHLKDAEGKEMSLEEMLDLLRNDCLEIDAKTQTVTVKKLPAKGLTYFEDKGEKVTVGFRFQEEMYATIPSSPVGSTPASGVSDYVSIEVMTEEGERELIMRQFMELKELAERCGELTDDKKIKAQADEAQRASSIASKNMDVFDIYVDHGDKKRKTIKPPKVAEQALAFLGEDKVTIDVATGKVTFTHGHDIVVAPKGGDATLETKFQDITDITLDTIRGKLGKCLVEYQRVLDAQQHQEAAKTDGLAEITYTDFTTAAGKPTTHHGQEQEDFTELCQLVEKLDRHAGKKFKKGQTEATQSACVVNDVASVTALITQLTGTYNLGTGGKLSADEAHDVTRAEARVKVVTALETKLAEIRANLDKDTKAAKHDELVAELDKLVAQPAGVLQALKVAVIKDRDDLGKKRSLVIKTHGATGSEKEIKESRLDGPTVSAELSSLKAILQVELEDDGSVKKLSWDQDITFEFKGKTKKYDKDSAFTDTDLKSDIACQALSDFVVGEIAKEQAKAKELEIAVAGKPVITLTETYQAPDNIEHNVGTYNIELVPDEVIIFDEDVNFTKGNKKIICANGTKYKLTDFADIPTVQAFVQDEITKAQAKAKAEAEALTIVIGGNAPVVLATDAQQNIPTIGININTTWKLAEDGTGITFTKSVVFTKAGKTVTCEAGQTYNQAHFKDIPTVEAFAKENCALAADAAKVLHIKVGAADPIALADGDQTTANILGVITAGNIEVDVSKGSTAETITFKEKVIFKKAGTTVTVEAKTYKVEDVPKGINELDKLVSDQLKAEKEKLYIQVAGSSEKVLVEKGKLAQKLAELKIECQQGADEETAKFTQGFTLIKAATTKEFTTTDSYAPADTDVQELKTIISANRKLPETGLNITVADKGTAHIGGGDNIKQKLIELDPAEEFTLHSILTLTTGKVSFRADVTLVKGDKGKEFKSGQEVDFNDFKAEFPEFEAFLRQEFLAQESAYEEPAVDLEKELEERVKALKKTKGREKTYEGEALKGRLLVGGEDLEEKEPRAAVEALLDAIVVTEGGDKYKIDGYAVTVKKDIKISHSKDEIPVGTDEASYALMNDTLAHYQTEVSDGEVQEKLQLSAAESAEAVILKEIFNLAIDIKIKEQKAKDKADILKAVSQVGVGVLGKDHTKKSTDELAQEIARFTDEDGKATANFTLYLYDERHNRSVQVTVTTGETIEQALGKEDYKELAFTATLADCTPAALQQAIKAAKAEEKATTKILQYSIADDGDLGTIHEPTTLTEGKQTGQGLAESMLVDDNVSLDPTGKAKKAMTVTIQYEQRIGTADPEVKEFILAIKVGQTVADAMAALVLDPGLKASLEGTILLPKQEKTITKCRWTPAGDDAVYGEGIPLKKDLELTDFATSLKHVLDDENKLTYDGTITFSLGDENVVIAVKVGQTLDEVIADNNATLSAAPEVQTLLEATAAGLETTKGPELELASLFVQIGDGDNIGIGVVNEAVRESELDERLQAAVNPAAGGEEKTFKEKTVLTFNYKKLEQPAGPEGSPPPPPPFPPLKLTINIGETLAKAISRIAKDSLPYTILKAANERLTTAAVKAPEGPIFEPPKVTIGEHEYVFAKIAEPGEYPGNYLTQEEIDAWIKAGYVDGKEQEDVPFEDLSIAPGLVADKLYVRKPDEEELEPFTTGGVIHTSCEVGNNLNADLKKVITDKRAAAKLAAEEAKARAETEEKAAEEAIAAKKPDPHKDIEKAGNITVAFAVQKGDEKALWKDVTLTPEELAQYTTCNPTFKISKSIAKVRTAKVESYLFSMDYDTVIAAAKEKLVLGDQEKVFEAEPARLYIDQTHIDKDSQAFVKGKTKLPTSIIEADGTAKKALLEAIKEKGHFAPLPKFTDLEIETKDAIAAILTQAFGMLSSSTVLEGADIREKMGLVRVEYQNEQLVLVANTDGLKIKGVAEEYNKGDGILEPFELSKESFADAAKTKVGRAIALAVAYPKEFAGQIGSPLPKVQHEFTEAHNMSKAQQAIGLAS